MRHSVSRSILLACGACAAAGAAMTASRAARAEARAARETAARPPRRRIAEPLQVTEGTETAARIDPARHRAGPGREGVEALSRRKQDFLGLLSHELRNPLSAINVALAVMRARPGVQAGQQARTVIERQVAHITRLVDDLVDTARIERGTLSLRIEPVDLRDVLATAVEMAQPSVEQRGQTFDWTPAREAMLVSGDRVRLQQVFSNLLLNASKYTPEGGRIELCTSADGDDFRVTVRDNGQGIPSEDLGRVFEPFVRATRDAPGLGVGLYVARTLIEQHGGTISVESGGANAGAAFTVRLPELSPLFRQKSVE
jgi:signal transduction histidine kinase